MSYKRHIEESKIFNEMTEEHKKYWFEYRKEKFLHQIDTFYYSILLSDDFTKDSNDNHVKNFATILIIK